MFSKNKLNEKKRFYKYISVVIGSVFFSSTAIASLNSASNIYGTRMERTKKYRKLVIELSQANLHFSAIPWMKEYLISSKSKLDSMLEAAFESILTHTGSKQFELLPLKYLIRSSSNSLRFVIAKKLYKEGKYSNALTYAKKINPNHPVYPFSAHLVANIYSAQGSQSNALNHQHQHYNHFPYHKFRQSFFLNHHL